MKSYHYIFNIRKCICLSIKEYINLIIIFISLTFLRFYFLLTSFLTLNFGSFIKKIKT